MLGITAATAVLTLLRGIAMRALLCMHMVKQILLEKQLSLTHTRHNIPIRITNLLCIATASVFAPLRFLTSYSLSTASFTSLPSDCLFFTGYPYTLFLPSFLLDISVLYFPTAFHINALPFASYIPRTLYLPRTLLYLSFSPWHAYHSLCTL